MEYIDSGSVMLNLALSGKVNGGWTVGRISNVVGDKSSGKTLLFIEAANALQNDKSLAKEARAVYYIETEESFDYSYASNLGLEESFIKKPEHFQDFSSGIETIEDLCAYFDVIYKDIESKGYKKVLICVDSLDSIYSKDDMNLANTGYNMLKQKKMGHFFQKYTSQIKNCNAHLMLISQIRDTISPYGARQRRSGGKALDFYTSQIVWLKELNKIVSKETGLTRGITIEGVVKKNKVSAPDRTAQVHFFQDYGIENITGLLTFLVKDKLLDEKFLIPYSKNGFYTYSLIGQKEKNFRYKDLLACLSKDGEEFMRLVRRAQNAWDDIEKRTRTNLDLAGKKEQSSLLCDFDNWDKSKDEAEEV